MGDYRLSETLTAYIYSRACNAYMLIGFFTVYTQHSKLRLYKSFNLELGGMSDFNFDKFTCKNFSFSV